MQITNLSLLEGVTFTGDVAPIDQYWANVSLLTETTSTNTQTNNVFLDSSTNNFTVTRAGTTTQGSRTPFTVASGASYSTSTNGGSGYFNGSTDYLSVADNAALQMGTGDFTIEFWLNFNSLSNYQTIFDKGYTNAGALAIQTGNGTGGLIIYMNGSAVITESSGGTVGSWVHYALVRNGSSVTLYRNGVSVGSASNSTNLNNTATLGLAGNVTGAIRYYFNGVMSSFRVVKGTAVYTSAFTVPTSPLTAISGTSLLLNFTNAGMYDAAAKNNMTSVGSAQVSTTQAKWSPTSAYFNGTSDSLQIPSSAILYPTMSDDFTAEMWAYPATSQSLAILMGFNSSTVLAPWVLRISFSTLEVTLGNISITQGTVTVGQWNHIAFTKSGSTVRLFLNGVQQGSNATVSSITVGGMNFTIGDWSNGGRPFNGYIQDVRITNGVARYTSDFAVPTAAFPTTGPQTIDYLVVAGGGSGAGYGTAVSGAGGGAGGLLSSSVAITSGATYTIAIGAGGTGTGVGLNGIGNNGANSSISGTGISVTSIGGGGGGFFGQSAGSGGSGGGTTGATGGGTPGTGTAGPPRQGYNGALGTGNLGSNPCTGGGGGGAGAAASGGTGGTGVASSISGSSVTYASGGSNGTTTYSAGARSSVIGGGGNGTVGGSNSQGGGNGVVIIRYPDTYPAASATTGSPTVTVSGGYRVYQWTTVGAGSITF